MQTFSPPQSSNFFSLSPLSARLPPSTLPLSQSLSHSSVFPSLSLVFPSFSTVHSPVSSKLSLSKSWCPLGE
ncbi:Uncharacterized protein TCM_002147 [Theobroma cacao]|uniref:Uncharacterized protein n=1 Tax=Theobroma cacao TaxID=3641 RepID=A0A061DKJ9_THECC|nr:Uncharacterized protein TCM_002147 [Theobroma cacao]